MYPVKYQGKGYHGIPFQGNSALYQGIVNKNEKQIFLHRFHDTLLYRFLDMNLIKEHFIFFDTFP